MLKTINKIRNLKLSKKKKTNYTQIKFQYSSIKVHFLNKEEILIRSYFLLSHCLIKIKNNLNYNKSQILSLSFFKINFLKNFYHILHVSFIIILLS